MENADIGTRAAKTNSISHRYLSYPQKVGRFNFLWVCGAIESALNNAQAIDLIRVSLA